MEKSKTGGLLHTTGGVLPDVARKKQTWGLSFPEQSYYFF
jgi:hypothetical protein